MGNHTAIIIGAGPVGRNYEKTLGLKHNKHAQVTG